METQKQTLDERLRNIGDLNKYDTMMLEKTKPVNPEAGDEELGPLSKRQRRLCVLIHLLESRLEQVNLEFSDMAARQQAERDDSKGQRDAGDTENTGDIKALADEIKTLNYLIPLLEEHFWSEVEFDFCSLQNRLNRSCLEVRWYYTVVAVKHREKSGSLRMSLLKAVSTVVRRLRSPNSRAASPA